MNGNWGRILAVDLTTGGIEERTIEESAYRRLIGGSGLAAYLFFKLKGHEVDALSSGNPLIILNGPLSGTTLPGCSRLEVCARSPLTGI